MTKSFGRIRSRQDFPPQAVTDGATIIRKFIEEYHEKLEEDHLFPRFRKAGKLVSLVDTLLKQHQAGRRITERVLVTALVSNCSPIASYSCGETILCSSGKRTVSSRASCGAYMRLKASRSVRRLRSSCVFRSSLVETSSSSSFFCSASSEVALPSTPMLPRRGSARTNSRRVWSAQDFVIAHCVLQRKIMPIAPDGLLSHLIPEHRQIGKIGVSRISCPQSAIGVLEHCVLKRPLRLPSESGTLESVFA